MTTAMVDDLAMVGPFFTIHTHLPEGLARDPWHPMSELLENPHVLRERVGTVRAQLAAAGMRPAEAVELRVAASVTHLGVVARLISPALRGAVTHGLLLEVDLAQTWWQRVLGGPFPLSLARDAGSGADGQVNPDLECLATRLRSRVLDGPIRELVEAARSLSVSPRVLWGNVASAVNGAASMITRTRVAAAEPATPARHQPHTGLRRFSPSQLLPDLPGRADHGRPGLRRLHLVQRSGQKSASKLGWGCSSGSGGRPGAGWLVSWPGHRVSWPSQRACHRASGTR